MKKIFVFLALSIMTSELHTQDITEGLIRYWPLNGNVTDSIGNTTGVAHNISATEDRFGQANGGIHFNGNSYASLGSIGNKETISFSFWVKINQTQSNTPNVYIDYGNRRAIVNFTSNSEAIRFWGYNSNDQVIWSPQPRDTLRLTEWHHIVATMDWVNKLGSFYIDGTAVQENVPILGPGPAWGGNLIIGSENGTQYFINNGSMDDLKVYDRILNSIEVSQLYNYIPTSSSNSNELWNESDDDIYFNDGNVGIGTTNPGEKLEVNGTIRSKKVKVEATNWPDYVFEESYKLQAISEVEDFVKRNGHLPEVPSAAVIEKEGLDLGSMDATLLKKVEELTLYIIEQEKKIEEQTRSFKAQAASLKEKDERLSKLEAQNSQLKVMLLDLKKEIESLKKK